MHAWPWAKDTSRIVCLVLHLGFCIAEKAIVKVSLFVEQCREQCMGIQPSSADMSGLHQNALIQQQVACDRQLQCMLAAQVGTEGGCVNCTCQHILPPIRGYGTATRQQQFTQVVVHTIMQFVRGTHALNSSSL
jgi:hypothetical protein